MEPPANCSRLWMWFLWITEVLQLLQCFHFSAGKRGQKCLLFLQQISATILFFSALLLLLLQPPSPVWALGGEVATKSSPGTISRGTFQTVRSQFYDKRGIHGWERKKAEVADLPDLNLHQGGRRGPPAPRRSISGFKAGRRVGAQEACEAWRRHAAADGREVKQTHKQA